MFTGELIHIYNLHQELSNFVSDSTITYTPVTATVKGTEVLAYGNKVLV